MPNQPPLFSLITADRLLDGGGTPPLRVAALLIEDGRIARFGRQAEVRAPDGAPVERRDYGDATILPGLVDAHTHLVAPGDGTLGDDVAKEDDDILLLQAAANARTVLHSGVTTARENGAKEAWFVDGAGHVTEGSSSNAWIVTRGGKVVTRPADNGILRGITRTVLIDVIRAQGLEFEERPFTVEEAYGARD